MELYLFLSLVNVADAVILRFIPKRRPIARFVCKSILFAIETVLLVALVRSPLHPVYRPQDLPRMFWIQVLISCWWVLAARELVSLLALMTALRRSAVENKLLSNIISVSIYLCAGLAILGFVFEFPILDHPPASVAAADFKADRITYDVNFSTASIDAAGDARSQLIAQIYKRARPAGGRPTAVGLVTAQDSAESRPIFLFPESELFNHIPLLEPLAPSEKDELNTKIIRRTFSAGEQLLAQGETIKAVQFVFSGVIEATRQVPDGRKLKVVRLGPGDSFGTLSLLTGMHTEDVTLTAITSGLLLGLYSKDLEPILQSRPELVELLSHSVSKLQQTLAMFDKSAAIQPAAMSQPDLLWHIRKFFRLRAGPDLN